jgi:hypothetical protein
VCTVRAMQKHLKLSSDGDESGSKNSNEGIVGCGQVCVWGDLEVWGQAVGFLLVFFEEINCITVQHKKVQLP